MRTLVYKIKVSDLDKEFLKNYQKDYSIDFRKIYMNFELQKDSNFIKSLRIKNSKLLEYTLKEVIAFKEKYNSTQTKILDKINENQELIITPKYDGLSLCVNEETNYAWTRGDGEYGQKITRFKNYIKKSNDPKKEEAV